MTRSQATPQSSQMIWMEQRIAELEKDRDAAISEIGKVAREITTLITERDKATQYWQIAEGRCDALQANLEVARHNCEAQERENERLQELCDRLGEVLEYEYSRQCMETNSQNRKLYNALAAWREMKGNK